MSNTEAKKDDNLASVPAVDCETPGYADLVETLREMTKIQCSNGNWNYDAYMHGMANGMIFALSLFDNKPPEYLEAPEKWLCDLPEPEKGQEPVSSGA